MTRHSGVILSDKLYETIKWAVGIVLPAFATMYLTLGQVWNWPNVNEIVASVTALTTFLGVVVGVSTHQYNQSDAAYDGTMRVNRRGDGQLFDLVLAEDPLNIATRKDIRFRVDTSNSNVEED